MRSKGLCYLATVALLAQLTVAGRLIAEDNGNREHGQPHVISFDAPNAQGTIGVAINGSGVVVGFYSDANSLNHGFLRYPDGHVTTFDPPEAAGYGTLALAINAEGAAVGSYTDANFLYHGFLRRPDGRISTFSAPKQCTSGDMNGCPGTGFYDINVFGGIDGAYIDANFIQHSFLISPYGEFTEFDAPGAGDTAGSYQGTLPGSFFYTSSTGSLNKWGAITGYYVDTNFLQHGFVRNPDGSFASFDPAGSTGTVPGSINDQGVVSGYYVDSNLVVHGFVRSAKGRMVAFDAPGAGSAANTFEGTFPSSIDASGSVYGSYTDANNVSHGFVRCEDGKITTFDVPSAGKASGQGTFPYNSNDEGDVTGYYIDESGVNHGFVRIP